MIMNRHFKDGVNIMSILNVDDDIRANQTTMGRRGITRRNVGYYNVTF
jgi:hypothetical protein